MGAFDVQQPLDGRIGALAATQYGVVSRAQLTALGASRRQIERRREAGRLIALHRGVYAVGHAALRIEGRWLAATLACDGALSHTAAAALWELRPIPSGRIHVTTRRGGRKALPGIVLHTTTVLEATAHRGIPVTTPLRTLLDLATVLGRPALARAAEAAEARQLDVGAVPPRRRGSPAVRAQLAAPPSTTRSDFEAVFLDLCDRHELPRPRTNHRVGPYEVDAVWPDRRLVVECDGFGHHGTRHAFERDRERDAVLRALGYQVQRFTYRQLTRRPQEVVAALRAG
jgi:very-short-patch-repair endonuclease